MTDEEIKELYGYLRLLTVASMGAVSIALVLLILVFMELVFGIHLQAYWG